MDDAFEMATDVVGRDADHHPPPHPAAAAGGRALRRRSDGSPLRRAARAAPGPPHADRAVRSVRRTRSSSAASTRRRLPVPAADRPPRRRRARRSKPTLGADYDTDWARRRPARVARSIITNGPLRLAVQVLASPEIRGVDRLADLRASTRRRRRLAAGRHLRAQPPQPPRHAAAAITSIPEPWRAQPRRRRRGRLLLRRATSPARRRPWSSTRIPIDRATWPGGSRPTWPRELIDDGWSLVIFPEGGRSPDGWGQPFKGGAAFLSIRTGAPVVPCSSRAPARSWARA